MSKQSPDKEQATASALSGGALNGPATNGALSGGALNEPATNGGALASHQVSNKAAGGALDGPVTNGGAVTSYEVSSEAAGGISVPKLSEPRAFKRPDSKEETQEVEERQDTETSPLQITEKLVREYERSIQESMGEKITDDTPLEYAFRIAQKRVAEAYARRHAPEEIEHKTESLVMDTTKRTLGKLFQRAMDIMEETDVPKELKIDIAREWQKVINAKIQSWSKPQTADLSDIPVYPGKRESGIDGCKWLEDYYGWGLKSFGAERNHFYREDINAHDPKLVARVERECRVKNIESPIPNQSDQVNDQAKDLGIKDLKPEALKTVLALAQRDKRSLSL
jgi:hypothetical protein